MRTIWVLLGMLTTTATPAVPCAVNVRMRNVAAAPPGVIYQAKATVSAMFARIGVKLQWTGAHACGKPIEIRLETADPGPERPDSLAYAMPYLKDGTSIHVFINRAAAMVPANRLGTLLGHVLAHEITHVLEGANRHSSAGVMKARWDARDFRAMQSRPLPFDGTDVLLLQATRTATSTGSTNAVAAAKPGK